MIYFQIPLTGKTIGPDNAYTKVKLEVGTADRNVVFNDVPETVDIQLTYAQLFDKQKLPVWLRQAGINMEAEPMITNYATAQYKALLARPDFLQDARDELRPMPNLAAAAIPVNDLALPAKDATAAYLGGVGNQGLVLGRAHGQKASLELLKENIKTGAAQMLFLEEFTTQEQDELNDYLNGIDPVYTTDEQDILRDGTPEQKDEIEWRNLPPVLKEKVAVLSQHAEGSESLGKGWASVLREAKRANTKIFAVDDGEARPFGGVDSERSTEQRDVMMNAVVKRVMEDKIAQFPNLKYIAVVGAAHSNTHRGGIPGVSQMFGIPAVRVDPATDRVVMDPEDQTLRNMPSKDEQYFIDRFLGEAEAKNKRGPGGKPRSTTEITEANKLLRKKAEQAAAAASATGILPSYEEQLFLETYEKKALTSGAAGTSRVDAQYAAQRRLIALKQPLAAQFQLDYAAVNLQVIAYANVQPVPVDLAAVQQLLVQAQQEGARGQLDSLKLALDKLQCITQMIQGQPAQPLAEVDLTQEVAQDNNVAADVAAAKLRVDSFKEIRELITGKDDLGNPVPKDFKEARKKIRADPTLIDVVDENGRNLLHYAAGSANQTLLASVLRRCNPQPIDRPDKDGNTALHLAVADRLDLGGPTGTSKQRQCVDRLIAAGADVDSQNLNGSTPLHLAVMTNSTKVVKALFDANADETLTDQRGWTPLTTTIGATSVDVERLFYAEHKGNPSVLGDPVNPLSTVDILCAATTCENPADMARVRESLTQLYANDTIRPSLELAALHCALPRNPPGGGGRIFISSGTGVRPNLYKVLAADDKGTPPEGAYDEGGAVTMVAVKSTKDFGGELAHELTHFAGHIINGNQGAQTYPYDNAIDKQRYIDAIEADAKTLHQRVFPDMDSPEYRIVERLSGRMNSYLGDPLSATDELLKECIVSIPQLIAEFGEPMVRKYAANLFAYYQEFSTTKCAAVAGTNRFDPLAIDNAGLANAQERDYPPANPAHDWLPKDSSMLQWPDLEQKLKTEFAVRHGAKDANTIAFDPSLFKLDQPGVLALQPKLLLIKKALEKSLAPDLLTTAVTTAGYSKLLQDIIDLVDNTPANELEKAVQAQTDLWLLKQKETFLVDRIGNDKLMDETELAEAVVLGSEIERMGGPGYTVDTKQHAKMVTELTASLKKLREQRKFPTTPDAQKALGEELTDSVYNKGTSKQERTFFRRNPDPNLVVLDVKNAKKNWVKLLKRIPQPV